MDDNEFVHIHIVVTSRKTVVKNGSVADKTLLYDLM